MSGAERLVQINAPHFTAGLVLVDGRCAVAAPILKWAVGKTEDQLRDYFSRHNWMWEEAKAP